MKKILLISGTVYFIGCLGVGIYMMINPEAYGKCVGKFMNGMIKEW